MTPETLSIIALSLAWLSWLGTVVYRFKTESKRADYLLQVALQLAPLVAEAFKTKTVPQPPKDPETDEHHPV